MDNSFDVTDVLSKGKKLTEAEKNKVRPHLQLNINLTGQFLSKKG
jgi:hypothetical protein